MSSYTVLMSLALLHLIVYIFTKDSDYWVVCQVFIGLSFLTKD